ncbi:MAG TPA: nucleoside recognition domain-containing protein [Verrucomicrobiaceae bacterium]|jgi:spore maturation protein SpmA
MLNYVWSFLLLTGLIVGACFGRLGGDGGVVDGIFTVCKDAIMKIALPLAGMIMLWLGVLRLMEKSGLLNLVARALAPIMSRLFPQVPKEHPAMGAMVMNIAANMLGLGNAATPLGLKAMEHLQSLNPHKQSASNAMCMFLALNTAGFMLIPITAINFLSAGGVKNPYQIIAPTLCSTLCATIGAIVAVKLLERLPVFRQQPDEFPAEGDASPKVVPSTKVPIPSRLRRTMIVLAAAGFALGGWFEIFPTHREAFLSSTGLQSVIDTAAKRKAETEKRPAAAVNTNAKADGTVSAPEKIPAWQMFMRRVSTLAIPLVLVIALLFAMAKGIPVYEEVVEGAKEGFSVVTRIMPFLVVMLTALAVFRDSGAMLLLSHFLSPVLQWIHLPAELLPMAIMRPLSGSGSQGILNEIILNPASTDFLKYTAAVMYGSTETTFYVLAVYFGSVGIRRIRHALAVGLIADVIGMTTAVTLGRVLFG